MITVLMTTNIYAGNYVYKCVDKKGITTLSNEICPKTTRVLAKTVMYKAKNPISIIGNQNNNSQITENERIRIQNEKTRAQNEITNIQNQIVLNNNEAIANRRYRIESNELIDKPKRKEAENQRKWDSLGRAGVTIYNSPNTYGQTQFSNH